MQWIGTWRNQYGSLLTIAQAADHRLAGTFRTALPDSGFYGQDVPVTGLYQGDCIRFAFAHTGAKGGAIASFTGLVRDGKIETIWHVVADPGSQPGAAKASVRDWAHAVMTNADTFERVG
ncbi:MAG TPA: avidin/streptavidin family protein [Pseudolabrys sp.]|nr:avidin/streptavidin family protein [Pseudolabrys sp.]